MLRLPILNKSVNYLEAALRIDPTNPLTIQSLAESKESIGRMEATAQSDQGNAGLLGQP